MSELSGGVMLTENALRCVAQSIEMFYKKKAQNRDWCITTVRNAADQFEKMREEISTLRVQPANEPLTLEQLKQMDGEPVWCADGEGHSCYCLVNAESEDCIDSECGAWCFEFYGMTGDGENGLHNMGWLAYRHKPKEEHHEAD